MSSTLIMIDAVFPTKNSLFFFVPGVASDQPNESEIGLGLSEGMLMNCGTPEPPAAPSQLVSLAMVNLATKAFHVLEKMTVHEILVATMLEMIPTRPFLGNLDP